MITFIANFPARTVKGFTKCAATPKGEKVFPAHTKTVIKDETGNWSIDGNAVFESDVIDACRKATNWGQIKSQFFAMADINKTDSWV